ncbi:MAG: hypothetical protein R6U96_10580, partial [Promethearchaeia archaeon]
MQKRIRQLCGIFLLLLFLAPMHAMFLDIPNNLEKTTASKDEDDTSKYDSPRSSTNVNVSTFKINDTKIYRNGTFYLFQNDTLFFSLTDPDLSGIEDYDVNITVEHESEDIIIDLDSSDNKEWNATHKFDVATDKCVAYLTYRNNEEVTNFNFNLDINNPSPRIVNVWGKDSNFNQELTPIYEKGIYSTYRGTDFDLTVEVLNKEGDIDNVELDYTDYNLREARPNVYAMFHRPVQHIRVKFMCRSIHRHTVKAIPDAR